MIFGAIALFLAAIGLYAVMAFSVDVARARSGYAWHSARRRRTCLEWSFDKGLWQLGAGMAVGLTFALGVAQLMKVVLFDVQPRDPEIFGLVVAVLSVAGLLACLIPAQRATRVDPLVALRSE